MVRDCEINFEPNRLEYLFYLVLFDGFLNIDQLKDLIKAISRTKRHEWFPIF